MKRVTERDKGRNEKVYGRERKDKNGEKGSVEERERENDRWCQVVH